MSLLLSRAGKKHTLRPLTSSRMVPTNTWPAARPVAMTKPSCMGVSGMNAGQGFSTWQGMKEQGALVVCTWSCLRLAQQVRSACMKAAAVVFRWSTHCFQRGACSVGVHLEVCVLQACGHPVGQEHCEDAVGPHHRLRTRIPRRASSIVVATEASQCRTAACCMPVACQWNKPPWRAGAPGMWSAGGAALVARGPSSAARGAAL